MTQTAVMTPDDAHRPGWAAVLRQPLVLALLGLLLLQLLLAALLAGTGGQRLAPAATGQALLPVAADALTAIELTAGAETLTLTRTDAGWVLPDLGDFPASATRIDQLLADLADLKRPLPVATTAAAHRRFKVTDDAPERVLTLRDQQGQSATLLLGDSPGFRRLFARLAGADAVYDIRLGLTDLTTRADDWIDRGLLRLDRNRIERVAGPGWTLVKGGDGWTLEGSADRPDPAAVDAVLNALAALGYSGVFGTEAPAGAVLDPPALSLTVGLSSPDSGAAPGAASGAGTGGEPGGETGANPGAETRRFDLGRITDSEDFVLKAADRPWYLRASGFDVGGLPEVTADKLLGKAAPAADGDDAARAGAGVDPGDGGDADAGAATGAEAGADAGARADPGDGAGSAPGPGDAAVR